jgi:excisionase family DNA binding protein
MPEMPRLLTSEEAAERLHISTKTLRQLRARGLIRYVAVTERKILYRAEDVDAFIESKVRQEPAAPAPTRRAGGGRLIRRWSASWPGGGRRRRCAAGAEPAGWRR